VESKSIILTSGSEIVASNGWRFKKGKLITV